MIITIIGGLASIMNVFIDDNILVINSNILIKKHRISSNMGNINVIKDNGNINTDIKGTKIIL